MKILAAVCFALIAASVSAHHGSTGQFDHENKIDVIGVVKEIKFVNPHAYVYFDVTNAEGGIDPWRCEMRAGSLLKKTGWTEEMFSDGTEIAVHGSQARREEFGCYVDNITFADGLTIQRYQELQNAEAAQAVVADVQLAAGTPNINGNWERAPRVAGAPRGGGPGYAQTEIGLAASAGFDREQNPRFACEVTNIFHDLTFDEHINSFEQSDDKIVMTYGFMDLVRTIHLDMDAHPANIVASQGGHSIGSWQGDTLVIDSIGFLPGYLEGSRAGVKHSDAMTTVERFSLSEDGSILNLSYTVTDPLYLSEPYNGSASLARTALAFDPYECDDLTEELVEGH